MKQLSAFMAINVNGGDRISYTYEQIDDETGEVVAANTKESFFVTDKALRTNIEAIRDYIRENKLS